MLEGKFCQNDGIYLLTHSVGLQPISTRESVEESFFSVWENEPEPWNAWIAGVERFRDALGTLFNASPAEFCPQTNVSSAFTKVLYSIPPRKGRSTILLTEQDFPSMGFVADRARRMGFETRFIPCDAPLHDADIWNEYLADDVLLVLATHVFSNTGWQAPVADICQAAREKGVLSVVDVAQSGGILPIDFRHWRADIVIGSCVKWLCGGPGAGYLWVSSDVISGLEPIDVGWFSHENPFDFDIHNFRYANSALRFWGGTPSALPYVTAENSVRLIHSLGVDKIRAHNLSLTRSLMEKLPGSVIRSPVITKHRGGTVVVDLGEKQQPAADRLRKSGVHFDIRGSGMRFSPHIYNTLDEMDVISECLAV